MAEAASTNFSHIMQLFKPNSKEVAKKQVFHQFRSFFTGVGPEMVVSGGFNNNRQ